MIQPSFALKPRDNSHRRDPVGLLVIGVSGLLLSAMWAAAGLLAQNRDQFAPLHYTIYFGIDLTAAANRLYLIPMLGTFIWVTHMIAARSVKHVAWRQAWLVMALIFEVMLMLVVASLAYIRTQT